MEKGQNTFFSLEDGIREALPSISDGHLESILSVLNALGVESEDDLLFVEVSDLNDLPLVKARKLVQYWKSKDVSVADEHRESHTDQGHGPAASASQPQRQGTSTSASKDHRSTSEATCVPDRPAATGGWSLTYQVPWHKFPAKLMEACSKDQKPDPKDRREMVRIIMDDIYGLHISPKRKDLRAIALKIVAKFGNSFADKINGVIIGDGSSTLLQQLESRKENLQRHSVPNRVKAASSTNEDKPPSKKSKKNLNSFGCLTNMWQPDLPEGESHGTQEQKKKLLQDEYEKFTWNIETVDNAMRDTYCTQRYDINNTECIEELLKQWPYLAEEKWLLDHFHCLTGINLLDILNDTLASKGRRMLAYFRTKSSPASLVEAVHSITTAVNKHQNQLAVLMGLPYMLAAHFREDVSALIRCYDETTTKDDIEDLPSTPCILVVGDLYSPNSKVFLSVDGCIINVAITPEKYLIMLFAAYYVFNIEYTKQASCTLDFVQRVVVGMNPSGGCKMAAKRGGLAVSGKVLSLANSIAVFESDWTNEL